MSLSKESPSSSAKSQSFGDQCMCLQLRRAARLVTQLYDEEVRPTGLSMAQYALLGGLARLGDATQTELAERLTLDPTTLTRTLAPLFTKHLITKRQRTEDRREHVLHVTSEGTAKLKSAASHWRQAQQRVRAALGDEAWTALLGTLGLLLSDVSKAK
jgi:DNA-binding MarR family transcriptional regulator